MGVSSSSFPVAKEYKNGIENHHIQVFSNTELARRKSHRGLYLAA